MHVVVRLQVFLQPLLVALLQERAERFRPLLQARLEQPAARDPEIGARAERLAERNGVASRHHGFLAGRAEAREDRVDQRLRISRPDTERIAGPIGDPGPGERHDVVLRVFRRAGRRQAVAPDSSPRTIG